MKDFNMPAIPEAAQKMRDAAAALLRTAADEKFIVVGVLCRREDGAIITLQNTKDDFVELMRAAADMAEKKLKTSPVIHDDVRRLN